MAQYRDRKPINMPASYGPPDQIGRPSLLCGGSKRAPGQNLTLTLTLLTPSPDSFAPVRECRRPERRVARPSFMPMRRLCSPEKRTRDLVHRAPLSSMAFASCPCGAAAKRRCSPANQRPFLATAATGGGPSATRTSIRAGALPFDILSERRSMASRGHRPRAAVVLHGPEEIGRAHV